MKTKKLVSKVGNNFFDAQRVIFVFSQKLFLKTSYCQRQTIFLKKIATQK
jgi:hypothetical protein